MPALGRHAASSGNQYLHQRSGDQSEGQHSDPDDLLGEFDRPNPDYAIPGSSGPTPSRLNPPARPAGSPSRYGQVEPYPNLPDVLPNAESRPTSTISYVPSLPEEQGLGRLPTQRVSGAEGARQAPPVPPAPHSNTSQVTVKYDFEEASGPRVAAARSITLLANSTTSALLTRLIGMYQKTHDVNSNPVCYFVTSTGQVSRLQSSNLTLTQLAQSLGTTPNDLYIRMPAPPEPAPGQAGPTPGSSGDTEGKGQGKRQGGSSRFKGGPIFPRPIKGWRFTKK